MKSTDIWNMSLAKGKTIVYEKNYCLRKKKINGSTMHISTIFLTFRKLCPVQRPDC